MIDGNIAALNAYHAEQDRISRQSPTDIELRYFIEDWMQAKCKKMGAEFITEAFCEAEDFSRLYMAYVDGGALDIGAEFKLLVAKYWTPMAVRAAEEHNFEEDRDERA